MKRSFLLHYLDGHTEHRDSYGYTEDKARIYFHNREDQSDHDSWVKRTLLIMIEDEEERVKSAKRPGEEH